MLFIGNVFLVSFKQTTATFAASPLLYLDGTSFLICLAAISFLLFLGATITFMTAHTILFRLYPEVIERILVFETGFGFFGYIIGSMLSNYIDSKFEFLIYYIAIGFIAMTFMLLTFIAFHSEIKETIPNSKWAFDDVVNSTSEMFKTGTVFSFATGVQCYMLSEIYGHLGYTSLSDSGLYTLFAV